MDKIFSPIKGRLIEFLDIQDIKKELFYQISGISSSNFKGKGAFSELGGDKIAKILTIYPQLSARWLVLGDGSMIRTSDPGQLMVAEAPTRYKTQCSLCIEKERIIMAKDELIKSLKREISLTLANRPDNKQTG